MTGVQTCALPIWHYVKLESRESLEDAVRKHCDFGVKVKDSVLRVAGFEGVGKSRTVFEAIASTSVPKCDIFCVDIFNPRNPVGHLLVNSYDTTRFNAVLVVDNCPNEQVYRYQEFFGGVQDRIRVIVMVSDRMHLWESGADYLQELTKHEIQQILLANYSLPDMPRDEIEAMVQDAGGSMRNVINRIAMYRHNAMQNKVQNDERAR